jgi:hypothetical protein
VLLEQQCTDQPIDGSFIGEDTDDVGTAFDFAVETFQLIKAVSKTSKGGWRFLVF